MAATLQARTDDLGGGWRLHVRGLVDADPWYDGGDRSGSRALEALPGGTVEALRDAVARRREADLTFAATPIDTELRAERGDLSVLVLAEQRRPAEGPATFRWPPILTPAGIVVRWERTVSVFERADGRPPGEHEAPAHTQTTVQRPWLIGVDGTARQLPFALGVPPLGAAPDGRLMLPCPDPLWWDGDDEPLTLLAHDGATEPLSIDGATVTPSRILAAIGERDGDAGGWQLHRGAFHEAALGLVLARPGDGAEVDWLAVSVPLGGRWSVRRLGAGTVPADRPTPAA